MKNINAPRTGLSLIMITCVLTIAVTSNVYGQSKASSKKSSYIVTIPATIDIGTIADSDFGLRPYQTQTHGPIANLQYLVSKNFNIGVSNASLAGNQFVEVKTPKSIKLTDASTNTTVPVTLSNYQRAFTGNTAKTSSVAMYKTDGKVGTYSGTTIFDVDIVSYKKDSEIKMAFFYNGFTWKPNSDSLKMTQEQRLAFLKANGYQAVTIGLNQPAYDLLKANGLEISEASVQMNAQAGGGGGGNRGQGPAGQGPGQGQPPAPGQAAPPQQGAPQGQGQPGAGQAPGQRRGGQGGGGQTQPPLTAAALIAASDIIHKQGIKFDNFKVGFTPDAVNGMAANYANIKENYAVFWESRVAKAVALNVELNKAKRAGATVDFWLTMETEPLGQQAYQSPTEIALFAADVKKRTLALDPTYTNYVNLCVDLVHTYSMMELGLGGYTKDIAINYFKSIGLVPQTFTTPKTICDYLTLCNGNVKSIQFSDNNGSTFINGGATGSHFGIGKGRIDWNEYMDALCNYAHFDGTYWVYEPWYNEGDNIITDAKQGTAWMKEWDLLYHVKRETGVNTQAVIASSGIIQSTELNKGNSISIQGVESITMKAGSKKATVSLQNAKSNPCNFIVSLVLDNGKVLYKSPSITPGNGIKDIALTETLTAGTYTATLKYESVGVNDQKAMNGANVKVKLVVE